MSNKLPQPTETLVQRLRRVAKWLDDTATYLGSLALEDQARWHANATTCRQAAARLEELDHDDVGHC